MDARGPARSVGAWRDRLAGRVPFDAAAAEASIRGAYRASSLPEPSQVLWMNGPADAAQAIVFLESPPRKWQRIAMLMLVLGSMAWVGLAIVIDGSAGVAAPPTTAAITSVLLGGLAVAIAGGCTLPGWPDRSPQRFDGKLTLVGAAVFVALAGHAFATQLLGGLPMGPAGRSAALALAASVGALPGVFLRLRVQRAYAHLPRSLIELAPSWSVACRIEQARQKAWAEVQRNTAGPRPAEELLAAYRSAHQGTFARWRANLLFNDLSPAPHATRWDGAGWIVTDGSRDPHLEAFGRVSPHLDGIEEAAQAAAVMRATARGTAAIFADLAFHVDRFYPFARIAVAVRPATTVALDGAGRPHAEEGPALAWADGTRIFAWHGRLILPDLLDREVPVTRSRINREVDADRRRVLIERYGLGRYLLEAGASEIQRDGYGRLYCLSQPRGEPILAVRVLNHTPEPDGSLREFWLRVPPTMTTANQAVAWTFGLPTARYDPFAQS